jgi:putative transposase
MPNHVHLVLVPWAADSLALMLHDSHMRYAQYFNEKYSRTGHLWENRYYSAVLDDFHMLAATRYTELNPVRARLVDQAWDYAWSSARSHIEGFGDDGGILSPSWPAKEMLLHWRSILLVDERPTANMIRQSTRKGIPLGSTGFVANLERLLGKQLQSRPRGRPRNK